MQSRLRYPDPRISRWLSTDPVLGEYIPQAGGDNSNLPAGGVFSVINLHLYHYAGNNPVLYLDPDGRFKTKQFIFALLQTVGGGIEVTAGVMASGATAGVSLYAVLDGLYNVGDGIIGMVTAAVDKDYGGAIPEVAKIIADKAGLTPEQQELAGSVAGLTDTVTDAVATKGLSFAGGANKMKAVAKIADSVATVSGIAGFGNSAIDTGNNVIELITTPNSKPTDSNDNPNQPATEVQ